MTAECLSLTGHRGTIIVEGPFAANTGYCAMLAAATGCPVLAADSATGTSQGAALLALGAEEVPEAPDTRRFMPEESAEFAAYAGRWRKALID